MTIAIDANEANTVNKVGIGRFAENVLKGIHDLNEKRRNPVNFLIYLKNNPLSHLPIASANWQYQKLSPSFFWSQLALPLRLILSAKKPGLLFSLSHYSPKFTAIESIISVMDLSYLHFPQMFKSSDLYKLKNWTAFSVKKAKKIITISRFSAAEIVKYYSVDPAKIIVAYPGVDRNIYRPKKSGKKKDFILYVGTLQPRKNIISVIEAFSLLEFKDNLHLKIVGKKGWLFQDIFRQVKKRGLTAKIVFTGFASERQLISYYQDALCLILPSFYEGFGIPVIEAFACGCPVIAANTSSLPEIVGNAGLLIDPHNPASIASAINRIQFRKNLRSSLINKGLIRATLFNWENTAQIVYTTLIDTAK